MIKPFQRKEMLFGARTTLVICIALQLLALAAFLRGFFPIKASNIGRATLRDARFTLDPRCADSIKILPNPCYVPRVFGRMVFILIDALRSDFVLPSRDNALADENRDVAKMEILQNLIRRKSALGFVSRAHPPTVTMPRIKVWAIFLAL